MGLERIQKTSRLYEVCTLLSRGMTNKQIAEVMGVKVKTVKFHIWTINKKLGTRNRLEILSLYLREKDKSQ